MKLEHIALDITDSKEVKSFYHDVLGMCEIKNYTLDENLANLFFNIKRETSLFMMQKDELVLELFVVAKIYKQGFNHICIKVENRKAIVSKAKDNFYKCIRIKRKYFDQIFISDNSGNIFEIKEVDKSLN